MLVIPERSLRSASDSTERMAEAFTADTGQLRDAGPSVVIEMRLPGPSALRSRAGSESMNAEGAHDSASRTGG